MKLSPGSEGTVSEAEKISALQRAIDADEARIKELQSDLDSPKSPYVRAESDFKTLDEQLVALRKSLKQAETDGNQARQTELAEQITSVEKTWEEAKRRFELEIEARKTKRASLDSLTARIKANRELLEKLRNPEAAPPPATTTPTPTPADATTPAAPTVPTETAPPPNGTSPAEMVSGTAAPVGVPATTTAPAQPTPPKDEKVQAAEAAVEELTQKSERAQAELEEVTQRIETLQKSIELERRLRDLARQKVIESEAEAQRLRQEYWQQLSDGDDKAAETRERLDEAQKRLQTASAEARNASTHLDELQSELALVQAEQIAAMREAEASREEVEQARKTLESLSSPWSPHRIKSWLLNQGTRILTIIALTIVVLWLARNLRKRLVHLLISRSRRGSAEEQENRARTLVGVFHNAFVTFTYAAAVVLVLEEAGFSVAPFLGGAAVVGLAVAFGTQSLIKDYFTGFIVLLEQQYTLNDIVKIGDLSGQVERITLRMTVLRDLEGRVHFIPHGQITSVTNMTHGWSRALFEVQVSYGSDINKAIRVLMDLGRELRRDPAYAPLIIEELSMLGVDSLGDSGIVIKFFIPTRPLQQWTIKREMLRRIKLRFDEEGIEIPFPQLTIHPKPAESELYAAANANPLLS